MKRDKWAEALHAYRAGTTSSLPADNPYRWLVQNHDGNNQHRGMQPRCPACGVDPVSAVVHLHADKGPCRTECGRPCGDREATAYRGLDPQRVTCTDCLERVRS